MILIKCYISYIDHPRQTDGVNCGPLSCLFIEQYVLNGQINMAVDTSLNGVAQYRNEMAEILKEHNSL